MPISKTLKHRSIGQHFKYKSEKYSWSKNLNAILRHKQISVKVITIMVAINIPPVYGGRVETSQTLPIIIGNGM